MKLSEYKNEDAINLLADLLDPISELFTDKSVIAIFNNKEASKIEQIQVMLRSNPKAIIKMFAILDNKAVEEVSYSIPEMIAKLYEIMQDTDLTSFFKSQAQNEAQQSSGPATETTKETETKQYHSYGMSKHR